MNFKIVGNGEKNGETGMKIHRTGVENVKGITKITFAA